MDHCLVAVDQREVAKWICIKILQRLVPKHPEAVYEVMPWPCTNRVHDFAWQPIASAILSEFSVQHQNEIIEVLLDRLVNGGFIATLLMAIQAPNRLPIWRVRLMISWLVVVCVNEFKDMIKVTVRSEKDKVACPSCG